MNSVGIYDNVFWRDYVQGVFTRAFNDKSIGYVSSQNANRIVKEFVLAGPRGVVKVESVWESNRLITMILYGGK
ncbi:hypothetical protein C0R09_11510 [Brevibacillus laterosporus]|nr:hypothetical protein C0R09_11510 [Brevibacillus laterosporus]